ncbi:MAG: ribosome biogenesis GTP-binding protein YihA/YsxC [bacterium]
MEELTKSQRQQGRKLFAGPCDFMLGVVSMQTLPADTIAEIAFAGRSNVGKSSLLNALTNRKALARTSNTPGRTRELNFFNLGGKLRLVDLPGYGYARASKTDIAGWNKLIRDYLRGRASLRRTCLLIDSRHGLKTVDFEIMDLLDEAAVPYQIVFTKTDKIKPTALTLLQEKTASALTRRPAAFPIFAATSSEKKTGLDELRASLAQLGGEG